MLSFEKSVIINETINSLDSKIVYPPQNLVDLIWKDKPLKSDAPVFKREIEYIGPFLPHRVVFLLFKLYFRTGHTPKA